MLYGDKNLEKRNFLMKNPKILQKNCETFQAKKLKPIYIYIYIEREREREKKNKKSLEGPRSAYFFFKHYQVKLGQTNLKEMARGIFLLSVLYENAYVRLSFGFVLLFFLFLLRVGLGRGQLCVGS